MKHILLADCSSTLNKEGVPYGHFIHFTNDMYNVLSNDFKVVTACSKEYANHLNGEILSLEPSISNNSKSYYKHITSRIILLRKVIKVLRSPYKNIIIQQAFLPIVLLGIFISNLRHKKIFIYIYSDIISGSNIKNTIYRLLYLGVKRKISGIVTTMEELSKVYNIKSIVVSDYFNREIIPSNQNYLFDIGLIGLINKWKDVETFVEAFKNTNFQILIAGSFSSKERYKSILKTIDQHKNITIINKYLDNDEYERYLLLSKYIILPYTNDNFRSSGVFYEALYRLKPLIVSSAPPFFKIVNEYGLGYQYSKSPKELIDKIEDSNNYNLMQENIKIFLSQKNNTEKNKIIEFFKQELN